MKLFHLLFKPLFFIIGKFPIDKKVSLVTLIIKDLVSYEKNHANSLKFLLKLEKNLYSITGQESVLYGDGLHTKHVHTKYHDFFVENISEGDKILDVGCGNGYLSYDIISKVKDTRLLGIDMNEKNVDFAKNNYKHPNLEFKTGNVLIDLPEEKFDIVILSNVLEHIEPRVKFLQQIKKIVKPIKFLIRVPIFERDWRVPLMKELDLDYRLDISHQIEYTQKEFINELNEAGLGIENYKVCWGEIWAVVKNIEDLQNSIKKSK